MTFIPLIIKQVNQYWLLQAQSPEPQKHTTKKRGHIWVQTMSGEWMTNSKLVIMVNLLYASYHNSESKLKKKPGSYWVRVDLSADNLQTPDAGMNSATWVRPIIQRVQTSSGRRWSICWNWLVFLCPGLSDDSGVRFPNCDWVPKA